LEEWGSWPKRRGSLKKEEGRDGTSGEGGGGGVEISAKRNVKKGEKEGGNNNRYKNSRKEGQSDHVREKTYSEKKHKRGGEGGKERGDR